MNKILALETNKYAIKLENFEGPLDLLCTLIEKNKMSIYDIKLDEITDQYIKYVNDMQQLNLEATSEFVVMASTLLYLKSKKLLPQKQDIEEEITEEELIRRIIEYKKYKDIKEKLKENFEKYSGRIFKLPENIVLPKQQLEEQYDKNLIYESYSNILKKNKEKVNENAKTGILLAITMTGCFLSGMMGITMKYVIDKNVPIINILNPANMITDGFYSLYYYDTLNRYYFNILSLFIFSCIMLLISYKGLRRQKYDSI